MSRTHHGTPYRSIRHPRQPTAASDAAPAKVAEEATPERAVERSLPAGAAFIATKPHDAEGRIGLDSAK